MTVPALPEAIAASCPGVRVNLCKSGVSTSLGPRGADVNIGRHGVTANAGIPGTGLSYRARSSAADSAEIGIVAAGRSALGFSAYQDMSTEIESLVQHPSQATARCHADRRSVRRVAAPRAQR